MHHWDFSLKRANMHLLPLIEHTQDFTGCILVDSTRRGKRYPDALSKTVPIWCCVVNHASHRLHGSPTEVPPLHVPSDAVSESERAQIEARIPQWVDKLCASDIAVPHLTKPLCPVFAHAPEIPTLPHATQHHVVLVSVSPLSVSDFHWPSATYVQGAGDDHEAWAEGLTPALYWRHRRTLLDSSLTREERIEIIAHLVAEERAQVGKVAWLEGECHVTRIQETPLYIQAVPTSHTFSKDEREAYALIVHAAKPPSEGSGILGLGLEPSKRGLHAFTQALPHVVDMITDTLWREAQRPSPRGILVCCTDGSQLSGALAVAVLAASFDEHRHLIGVGQAAADAQAAMTAHRTRLSKDATQRRLQWLTGSVSTASPSRSHLQRVNAFLIGPLRQVRVWPSTNAAEADTPPNPSLLTS